MEVTGAIVAALDCAPDAVEDWNRWYDVDHLPPNAALPGILSGRRYVATPPLHDARAAADGSWWAQRRSSFLTVYLLGGEPRASFTHMVELRDRLDAAGRMFAADRKAVRGGDVLAIRHAAPHPGSPAAPVEVPFLGHTAVTVLHHHGLTDTAGRELLDDAVRAPGVAGGVLLRSATDEAVGVCLLLLDDPPEATARELSSSYGGRTGVLGCATFEAIEPLRYPWAEQLRAAGLPRMDPPG